MADPTLLRPAEQEEAIRRIEAIMLRGREQSLPSPPEGATSERMEREQIADMVAASEARNETKLEKVMGEVRTEFAGLRGDIRTLDAKVSALPGRWELLAFIIGTAIALFAAILAALAFGGDNFSAGRDVGSQIGELSAKLDAAAAKPIAQPSAPPKP